MCAKRTDQDPILWKDRKRFLGMPLSFTRYEVTDDRLVTSVGLFSTETDEILLYRILDLKMRRSFGQKLCGVGTIVLYTADKSNKTLELLNVKRPNQVRNFLSKAVETVRLNMGLAGREIYGVAGAPVDEMPDFDSMDGE